MALKSVGICGALLSAASQIDVFSHQVQVFPKSKVDAVVLWVGPQEESRCPMTMTEMSLDGSHVRSLRSVTRQPFR